MFSHLYFQTWNSSGGCLRHADVSAFVLLSVSQYAPRQRNVPKSKVVVLTIRESMYRHVVHIIGLRCMVTRNHTKLSRSTYWGIDCSVALQRLQVINKSRHEQSCPEPSSTGRPGRRPWRRLMARLVLLAEA